MSGYTPTDDGLDDLNRTFRRLAETLDVPPTVFFDGTVCELSETNELLRLWQTIDGQSRVRVLEIVRAAASQV